MSTEPKKKTWILVVAIIAMVFLHHDIWYWEDATLVFGFLPIGLAYHMFYSIAVSVLFAFAVKFFWPQNLEDE